MATQAWGVTDIGRKRRHNEDSFFVDTDLGLYVVADGMGGHAAGEVASKHCVETIRAMVTAERQMLAKLPGQQGAAERLQLLLTEAIQKASAEIAEKADIDVKLHGMGTTCVALLTCGNLGAIAHVGDSRAYVVRGGKTHQLTEDHSLVEEHVKRGLMTRAQAEASDIRNVITRAVGVQAAVEVDTLVTEIQKNDVFLLCSDGLHGYLRDADEIMDLLANTPPSEAAQAFVDLANQRGGRDNITALVVTTNKPADELPTEIWHVDRTVEILRHIPLFQYMTYKESLLILGASSKRTYDPGEAIVREGEPGSEFFVILRGQVEVRKGDTYLTALPVGGHFGEMALIDQDVRSASVMAVEPTTVVVIARDPLLKLMRKDSLISVKLLWSFTLVMSERLRATNDTVISLRDELQRLRGSEPTPKLTPLAPPFGEPW